MNAESHFDELVVAMMRGMMRRALDADVALLKQTRDELRVELERQPPHANVVALGWEEA